MSERSRTLYRVADWEANFEVAQSKKIRGELAWVAIPTKHDGKTYRRLMRTPGGGEIYAAWVLIVQVAAKCRERGVLADQSGPLNAEDLALKTDYSEEVFEKALKVLSGPKIGWLVAEKWEQSTTTLPEETTAVGDENCVKMGSSATDITEQDKTEQTEQDSKRASARAELPAELLEWIDWWNGLKDESLVKSGLDRLHPDAAVLKAWKRVKESKELQSLLADRGRIETEIRQSAFCREGWFRLERLFGGNNRDGQLIVRKLVQGGYRDSERKRPANAGTLFDPGSHGQAGVGDI